MSKDLGPDVSRVLDAEFASFDSVVWNQKRPPLDSELNLMAEVESLQRRKLASLVTISGFSKALNIALSSEPNTYLAHTDLDGEMLHAIVNGFALDIGAINTSELTKVKVFLDSPATEVRTDLVFLEVWLARVEPESTSNKPSESTLYRFGNTQFVPSVTYPNLEDDLVDPEISGPTTYRVQVQYRVRVVSGVEFDDSNSYGLLSPLVTAQGQLLAPSLSTYFVQKDSHDSTLFIAGSGDPANGLSVDGYVYAIPMQKVVRRPSSDLTSTAIAVNDVTNLSVPVKIGIARHGDLTGLDQDDHTQYLTEARHEDLNHSFVEHSDLAGLTADDHTQYFLRAGRSGSNNYISAEVTLRGEDTKFHLQNTGGSSEYIVFSDPEDNDALEGGQFGVQFIDPDNAELNPQNPDPETILSLAPRASYRDSGGVTGELRNIEYLKDDIRITGHLTITADDSTQNPGIPMLKFDTADESTDYLWQFRPQSTLAGDPVSKGFLFTRYTKSDPDEVFTPLQLEEGDNGPQPVIIRSGASTVIVSEDTILTEEQKTNLTTGVYATDDGTIDGASLHTHPVTDVTIYDESDTPFPLPVNGAFKFTGPNIVISNETSPVDLVQIAIQGLKPRLLHKKLTYIQYSAPQSNKEVNQITTTFTMTKAGGAIAFLDMKIESDDSDLVYYTEWDGDSATRITKGFSGENGTIHVLDYPSGNKVDSTNVTICHPATLDAGSHTWKFKFTLSESDTKFTIAKPSSVGGTPKIGSVVILVIEDDTVFEAV